jgi:hypothetical protein
LNGLTARWRPERISESRNLLFQNESIAVKLVTFDSGRVGRLDGEDVIELDCATTREWFERASGVPETGARLRLADVIEGIGTPATRSCPGAPRTTGRLTPAASIPASKLADPDVPVLANR